MKKRVRKLITMQDNERNRVSSESECADDENENS